MEIREIEKIIDEAHKTHGGFYLLNEMRADYNNYDILCSFFIASGKICRLINAKNAEV